LTGCPLKDACYRIPARTDLEIVLLLDNREKYVPDKIRKSCHDRVLITFSTMNNFVKACYRRSNRTLFSKAKLSLSYSSQREEKQKPVNAEQSVNRTVGAISIGGSDTRKKEQEERAE
jgi:hypothetical protein